MEQVELRTYTSLWNVEKKIHKLYDFTLPVPIGVRQLAMFTASAIVWWTIMKFIGVPFAPPFGHVIWIAPPVLLSWAAGKPVAEGKSMGGLVISQLRYAFQSREYARLSPCVSPKTVSMRAAVWVPKKMLSPVDAVEINTEIVDLPVYRATQPINTNVFNPQAYQPLPDYAQSR